MESNTDQSLPTLSDQEKLAFRELQMQELQLNSDKLQRQSEFYQIELAMVKNKQTQLELLQAMVIKYKMANVDFDHQQLQFMAKP